MELISELWNSMAITGKLVVAVLGILSVYSYAVMVDRGLALRWNDERSAALAEAVAAADPAQGIAPLEALVEEQPRAPAVPNPGALSAAFDALQPLVQPGSLILILSDFAGLDAQAEATLAA